MKKPNKMPRIHVSSILADGDGHCPGRWIRVESVEKIKAEIDEILSSNQRDNSGGWVINGFENFAGIFKTGRQQSLDLIVEVSQLLLRHGDVFGLLVERLGGVGNIDTTKQYMENMYQGTFATFEEYFQERIEFNYRHILDKLPYFVRSNLDFSRVVCCMKATNDLFALECDGAVHVFFHQS